MKRLSRYSLRVRARFFLLLAVMVPVILAVGLAGSNGLNHMRAAGDLIYRDSLRTAYIDADLLALLSDAHKSAIAALLAREPAKAQGALNELVRVIAPRVEVAIEAAKRVHEDDPAVLQNDIATAGERWADFREMMAQGELQPSVNSGTTVARITELFEQASDSVESVSVHEREQALQAQRAARVAYRSSLTGIIVFTLMTLLLGIGVVLWLVRSVVPRTRRYSSFALRVAEGDLTARLDAEGSDEIADLGRTLDTMARRRHEDHVYEESQLEFGKAMMVAADEDEAHALLQHHLERSIEGASALVLNRNNSADRLEAVTVVPDLPSLREALQDAEPRSCLAVRLAQLHRREPNDEPLLACGICSSCPSASTCTPLLVGGEVIGSVLVTRVEPLDPGHERRVQESVLQAAPVLANLRTLAIAEMRASTDALTGLPNRRAVEDTLKRMSALAARNYEPLALLMFDLDHFKQVNDQHGHARGDEVLAAVGATITSTLRASDFAGRSGGEEFVVALPGTDLEGAMIYGEKLRSAIERTFVSGLDRTITASIGLAILGRHAVDVQGLERAADRALYVAKSNGRNRLAVAVEPDEASPNPPTVEEARPT